MAEYIDRKALDEACYVIYEEIAREGKDLTAHEVDQLMLRFETVIKSAPAAAVVPATPAEWVEKKQWHLGRWVAWFECSRCGEKDDNCEMYDALPFSNLPKYCPNCGSLMRVRNPGSTRTPLKKGGNTNG